MRVALSMRRREREVDTDIRGSDVDEDVDGTEQFSADTLDVHGHPRAIGDVRVRREVRAHDVEFKLSLAEQRLVLEWRRVWPPRPASGDVIAQSVTAKLTRERAIADKPTAVAEEVVLRKSATNDRVEISAKAKG